MSAGLGTLHSQAASAAPVSSYGAVTTNGAAQPSAAAPVRVRNGRIEVDGVTRLEADAQQAAVPLKEATDAGHAFVFTGLQERLNVARQRIAALYERLANP